jgi:hypothetical protein
MTARIFVPHRQPLLVNRRGVSVDYPGATNPMLEVPPSKGGLYITSTSSAAPTVLQQGLQQFYADGKTRFLLESWGQISPDALSCGHAFSYYEDNTGTKLGEHRVIGNSVDTNWISVSLRQFYTPPKGMVKFSMRGYRFQGSTNNAWTYPGAGPDWLRISMLRAPVMPVTYDPSVNPVLGTTTYLARFGGNPYSFPALNVVAGDLLIAALGGGDQQTGVSDNQGNTWVLLTQTAQGLSYYTRIAYCLSALSTGSLVVTVAGGGASGNAGRAGVLGRFIGGKVYDGVDVGVSNGSTVFNSPAFSTTAAGLVIQTAYDQGGGTLSVTGGTPPLQFVTQSPSSDPAMMLFYQSTTGALTNQQYLCSGGNTNHLVRTTAFK